MLQWRGNDLLEAVGAERQLGTQQVAWMSTVGVSETPMLAQDNRADVVVVGAGIAGLLPLRPTIATTEHIGSAVKRRRAATARVRWRRCR